MKMMPLRQRPARGFSVFVTLIFCVVLWSISRLRHHESLLPSTFDDWGGKGEWKGQGGGGNSLPPAGGGGKPTDQTTLQASQQLPYRPKLDPGQCSKDIEFLRRPELGLTDNILYSRRCIKPTYKADFDRNTVTNITGPLAANTTALDLTSCSHDEPIPCEPLSLEVPMPYPKDAQYPHLLFGVASKYERMREAIPAFAHWLSGTGARLVGTIADAVPQEHQDDTNRNLFNLTLLEEEYRAAGIVATFLPPKIFKRLNLKDGKPDPRPVPVEHHHFLLIKELLAVIDSSSPQQEEPHWLGILDDDTFFPSLFPLSTTLAKHDHTRPSWLGALSDDFMAVQAWGFMAFGGAGSFLSLPLARQLNPHLEECITTASIQTGDGILRDCIYSHTRTRLTLVEGLNQHDIKGDASGFFESGVWPVLSLHHWKSWYEAPVEKMARVARDVCGDCFLMRIRFGTGEEDKKKRKQEQSLLSLGYSITTYPGLENGLEDVDLSRVEGTWNEAGRKEKYAFSYGPVRRKLQEEKEKKSWRLVDVDVEDKSSLSSSSEPQSTTTSTKQSGGGVEGRGWTTHRKGKRRFRQIYVHKAAGPAVGESMDEVIELVWEI